MCPHTAIYILMQVVQFLVGAGRIPRTKVSKIVEAMPSLLGHRSLILLKTTDTTHYAHYTYYTYILHIRDI